MPDQEDRKITLDIFDIAYMLTDVLQERGFLAPHEYISVYDLEPAMEACGYYLTIERKGKKTEIRRGAQGELRITVPGIKEPHSETSR